MFEKRPGERICLAVIEDDLVLLVEECEDYLMGGTTPSRELWRSLLSRAECVVEELEGIEPTPRKRVRARRKSHPRLHSTGTPVLPRSS